MILFTIYDLFTMNVIWWGSEKKPEYNKTKCENQGKIPRLLPSHPPHVYEMEADCFPVSKDTENKPDLH